MPIDINRGEIANRLRRFLDIRGRIPTRLDENVVPVAQLGELDRPPYRQTPIIFADYSSVAAVAGEHGALAVTLPPSALGVMVVHRIRVPNLGTTNGADISLIMHSHAALIADLSDLIPQARRYENLDPAAIIANVGQPSGVHLLNGTILAASWPLLGAVIDRSRTQPPAVGRDDVIFLGPYVIPAGGGLYVTRATANETLNAHFYGEYYPDIPSSPIV